MKTPEGKIQAAIIKYLKEEKIFHFRYNAVSSSFGLPDIIAIVNGMFIGLEVKTPTGKATELQMKMQEAIIKAGGIYEFVTSVEEVRNIIQGRI
jgi:Holliday junction resolvase